MTKFGEKFVILIHANDIKSFVILNQQRQNDLKQCSPLQVIELLTKKTWGRGCLILVNGKTNSKMAKLL